MRIPEWHLWYYQDIYLWHQAVGFSGLHMRHHQSPAGLKQEKHILGMHSNKKNQRSVLQ